MTKVLRIAAVAALLVVSAACLEEVTGVRNPVITVTATPSTASVGDTVRVTYTAEGTGISQVTIDLGDGDEVINTYSGPISVTDFVEHTYAAAGSYDVAVALVSVAGAAANSITVTIN